MGDSGFSEESAEYGAARERLLEQEMRLRREIEGEAAARRALPPGGPAVEGDGSPPPRA
jgi:predicted dithiol-disulfide oxidoreductase (DUF899 family)